MLPFQILYQLMWLRIYKDRNGSLGGDILKRFNLFFDYANKKLYLKKNRFI